MTHTGGSRQSSPTLVGWLRVVVRVALAVAIGCANDGHPASGASALALTAGAPKPVGVDVSGGPAVREKAAPPSCNVDADCVDGCTLWYEDVDEDGYGNPDTARGFCGSEAPELSVPVVTNGHDCCDLNGRVNPAQTGGFANRIPEDCPLARGFDYDCDGVLRYQDDMGATPWAGSCDDTSSPNNDPNTPCAERSGIYLGPGNTLGLTPEDLLTPDGSAALCGNARVRWKSCSLVGDECVGTLGVAPACN